MVGDLVLLGDGTHVFVIAHNDHKVGGQFAQTVPVKKIGQAVIELGDEKCDPRALVGKAYIPVHCQRFGERLKTLPDLFFRKTASFEVPLDARKKPAGLKIDMLIGMKNIAIVMKDKIRNLVHQAFLILACH
jgi:hypothetical protein